MPHNLTILKDPTDVLFGGEGDLRIIMFYHSLLSDWNEGNAHFLRGVVTELGKRGHEVEVYESVDAWSMRNLLEHHGEAPIKELQKIYPSLPSVRYSPPSLDLQEVLEDVDLVIVHEWNEPSLIREIGDYRAKSKNFALLYHDTHHRAVSEAEAVASLNLTLYDGVLAFGDVLRDVYIERGWARRAWTWREAADTRVFKPVLNQPNEGDLVWVGNWGNHERASELFEFLVDPIRALGIQARLYGVGYPADAIEVLDDAGIEYGGWLPNYKVPTIFGRFRVTVHIPRLPYLQALPGIPNIRPLEAMACGIPLIIAKWKNTEGVFTEGLDYLTAQNGKDAQQKIQLVLSDNDLAHALSIHARDTVLARHTCAHRVDELLDIYNSL